MEEKIRQCFENLGFMVDESEEQNFNLSDYVTDSLSYISLIVELEQSFDIEIPDDYLMQGKLETFQDICNMITTLSGDNA